MFTFKLKVSYLILITVSIPVYSLKCITSGVELKINIPFDKGKPTGGYLSWIVNDETGKEARKFFDTLVSMTDNQSPSLCGYHT